MSSNASLGIVVGVDESPAAKLAGQWAARDAELRKISLTLVHAISPEIATFPHVRLPAGLARWQRDRGRQLVDTAFKLVEEASQRGGSTEIHSEILSSAAVPTLVDLSRNAQLVVTGCHGNGRWPGRPMGSVSSGLLRYAHCPVAIVHDEDPVASHPSQAPVLPALMARRHRSWLPRPHSRRLHAGMWGWSPCTHGAMPMSRSFRASTGLQPNRSRKRS